MCLLLDTWKRTDNFIAVYGKWIFGYNFEVVFTLTQCFLNYTCHGIDTYDITFVGVFHAIRAVPLEVIQINSNNIKY